MTWRQTDGGWNSHPYPVRWTAGGRWVARLTLKGDLPHHLGTYNTANEAKAACEEHRQAGMMEWESAGWGEK